MANERPPFRADHVGSLLRPPELLAARERYAAGELSAEELARCGGRGDPRRRRRCRSRLGCARRPTASSAGPPGTWTSSTSWAACRGPRARSPSPSATSTRRSRSPRPVWPLNAPGPPRRARSSPRPSASLASMVSTATPKLTIPSPSMVHYRGGRAAIDPTVYPDLDAFWSDLAAAYRTEVAAAARARLHLPAVRRHEPRLSERPRATRLHRVAGRRPRPPTRDLHRHDQRRDLGQTRIDGHHHPHVPRQLPVLLGRRGRLRLRRRGALRWAQRRRLLSRVRRRPIRRLRAAALRAARASGWCSAWSRQSAASSSARTISSDGSTRRPATCPLEQLCLSPQCGFSSTVEGNDLSPRRAVRQAGAHRRGRRRGVGVAPAQARSGKNSAISRAADWSESDPCTRLSGSSVPRSPRIVPGAAFLGSVAPIRRAQHRLGPSGPLDDGDERGRPGDELEQLGEERLAPVLLVVALGHLERHLAQLGRRQAACPWLRGGPGSRRAAHARPRRA